MAVTPITDHIDQNLAKLSRTFRRKPRFAAWCASILRQHQKLEDAIWQIINGLDVDTTDLPRLILLGKLVGQNQRGTLEQFRLYIKVRVLVNRSRGTAPNVIKIARILLGDITYREGGAHIWIEALEPIGTRDPAASVEFLRAAKAAGVGFTLTFSDEELEDSFSFAPGSSNITDGDGFASDAVGTDGGYLARAL